jgi:hypothetical protein
MEPALLLDIVHKMKKLEQKDIDDYLLSIQAAFYSAAKKIPTTVSKKLRSSTSLTYEKSNVTLLGDVLGDTFTTDGSLQRLRWACNDEQPGTVNHGKRANALCLLQQHLHLYLCNQLKALPLQQDLRYG